jgi:hypothetical protein
MAVGEVKVNIKNNNARRAAAKKAAKAARLTSPEQKEGHDIRDEKRHIARMGYRVLASSADMVPSMMPKRTWRDALKNLVQR